MNQDRITWIRVRGMRALKDITLHLRGLTVLVGDNGSGKSTLVEALEILRWAFHPSNFIQDRLHSIHGGLASLLRYDSTELSFDIKVEGGEQPPLFYSFTLGRLGTGAEVRKEFLDIQTSQDSSPIRLLERQSATTHIRDVQQAGFKSVEIHNQFLAVSSFGITAPLPFQRVLRALERVAVHVPFETYPLWLYPELERQRGLRTPIMVERAERLERFGKNLANCFHSLRNEGGERWQNVLDQAKFGLGHDLIDIRFSPPSRGYIGLEIVFRRLPDPVPVSMLSDGQISYLGFLALSELGASHSLVVFDGPELHLHPELITRVVWMLEKLGRICPVLVTTHSDIFLDALTEPATSVILCSLDDQRATTLERPDADALKDWLRDYRGIGQLRTEGYLDHVFRVEQGSSSS